MKERDLNPKNPLLPKSAPTSEPRQPDLSIVDGDFLNKCNPALIPAYFLGEARRHFALARERGVELSSTVEEYALTLQRNADFGETTVFMVGQ